jgi:hypothetical protein
MAMLRSSELAEEAMRQRLAEPSGVIRVTGCGHNRSPAVL